MVITKNTTVATRGIGKPDYSREVSSSIARSGIRLGYNQTLKIFGLVFSGEASPYSWIVSPLAPAATLNLIDLSTGLSTPFDISKGYAVSLIAASISVTEDIQMWGYIDGFLATSLGIFSSGITYSENRVIGLATEVVDPSGLLPHTIDATVENIGLGNLKGGIDLVGILEAIGTPPMPTTKTVRCKFCGYQEVVPQKTTEWVCPECGKLNIFYDFSKFRGTR